MPRQAILYLSHIVNKTQWRAFKRLKRETSGLADAYYVLNLSSEQVDESKKGTYSILPSQRRLLGHPSRAADIGWWMETAPSHTGVIRSGIDLAPLVFRRQRPEYEYYWIMEYDVDFSGRWSFLFNALSDSKADLLCTNLHGVEINPAWDWWKSMVWPGTHKPRLLRGMFPFARFSARSMDAIIDAGQNGVDGYYEVMWPTVVLDHGFTLEDIGGDGPFVRPNNVNRWYTSTLTSQTLSPGTFVARPIRMGRGWRRNTLWHPIKRPFIPYVLSRLMMRISPK